MMRRFTVVVAAMAIGSATFAAEPAIESDATSGPDIIGIRIGMQPDEVRLILNGRFPNSSIKTVEAEIGELPSSRHISAIVVNTLVSYAQSHELVVVEFSPPPSPSRVVRVSRSMSYVGSDQPSLSVVQQAMSQKYGTPSGSVDYGATQLLPKRYYWSWNLQGNRIQLQRVQPCETVTTSQELAMNTARAGRGYYASTTRSNAYAKLIAAGCNLTLGFALKDKGGIVERMDSVLEGTGQLMDAYERTDTAIAKLRDEALQRARQEADKKAPSL